jgi:thiosulfate dehydrogenase [quinone] large subunit
MNGNRISTSTIVLIIVAALVGFFFGYAMDATIGSFEISGGILWGAIFAVVSAVAAYVVSTTTSKTDVVIQENGLSHFLFQDTRSSALWFPVRVFVGLNWLSAGLHKLGDPKWMDGGTALKGYWENAVRVPDPPARAAITYDWWRSFLQGMLDNQSYTWFGPTISVGETLVGLGLIVGALVGIAAFFGIMLNTSFLLSGSTSSNPILLLLGILLILAWKVAGWIGLDRWLLPALGTPWHKGKIFGGQPDISPAPAAEPPPAGGPAT